MDDIDAALNELGMLSNVTSCRLEYLQDIEAAAEARKAASLSKTGSGDVTISVNTNFVTNISISTKYSDYSPAMRRKLELEIKDHRLSTHHPHICDKRHSCPSSHICSFVSPRRNRIVPRNSPYTSARLAPVSLRPAGLPGVLISSRTRSLGRLRGPVRFYEPLEGSPPSKMSPLYPLDEDLTSRLSAIQLSSISGGSGQVSNSDSVQTSLDISAGAGSRDVAKELSWDVSRLEIGSQTRQSGHS
eukprot:GFUD01014542.1.p1 GENE.GFUD01014542.1~~GFUD01014542.1.p1  ORF type:complete len:245 (+),score=66.00 GFUD01014542.1:248-982(+)